MIYELAKTEDLQTNYDTKIDSAQRIAAALEPYATTEFVTGAIADADISDKLNDYYKKSETYSSTEIDDKLKNVKVLLKIIAGIGIRNISFGPNTTFPLPRTLNKNAPDSFSILAASLEIGFPSVMIIASPRYAVMVIKVAMNG